MDKLTYLPWEASWYRSIDFMDPSFHSLPRTWIASVVISLFVPSGGDALIAQEDEVPLAVAALVEERDRSLERQIGELKEKYVAGLEKFRASWAVENKLDDALAALELKNQLEENNTLSVPKESLAKMRGELSRVVEGWDITVSQYQKEANALLSEKLEEVRVSAIKRGDLDLVKAVDRQLKELEGGTVGAMGERREAEDEEGGDEAFPVVWNWGPGGSGGTLQLLPDGTAMHSRWGSLKGKWEWTRKGSRIDLTHPNGSMMEIRFDRDGTGEVIPEKGRPTTVSPKEAAPPASK